MKKKIVASLSHDCYELEQLKTLETLDKIPYIFN